MSSLHYFGFRLNSSVLCDWYRVVVLRSSLGLSGRLLHVFTQFSLRSRVKLLNWISVQPSGRTNHNALKKLPYVSGLNMTH